MFFEDERLHLTVLRDLRPNGQLFRIHFDYGHLLAIFVELKHL